MKKQSAMKLDGSQTRYLAGILWGIDGLVNRKNKKAKKLTYELVNKYKSFDKITLEEFLKVLS